MATIQKKYEVEYTDLNVQNVLSNHGFLRMLEDIAILHGDMIGISARTMEKTKLTWILLGWHVEIYTRPKLLDEITIKTWCTGIQKRLYSFRDFEVYNKEGVIIARATSKWILYNFEKQMPIRVPLEYMDKFEFEENFTFGMQDTISTINEVPTSDIVKEYTVLKKDIDLNLHLHNTNYLDIAEEALPIDVYKNVMFNKFNIIYKKQFLYNEKILCALKVEHDNSYNISLKDENNVTHAYVKLYN